MMRLATLSALLAVSVLIPRTAEAQTPEIQAQVQEALAQAKAKEAEALRAAQDAADKKKANKATAAQPTYEFEMRNKPWIQVFDWLADKTGRRVVGSGPPAGTF